MTDDTEDEVDVEVDDEVEKLPAAVAKSVASPAETCFPRDLALDQGSLDSAAQRESCRESAMAASGSRAVAVTAERAEGEGRGG